MFYRIHSFLLALSLIVGFSASAHAGETVLTVTHDGQTTTFDRDALTALGTEVVETTTIWTEGPQTFGGVSLLRVMQEIGAQEGVLRATAINDYTVEIPVSDAVENGPILAITLNGEEMSVRDKGPLWVIYPYDSDADYRSEVIYSRSIWQLDRIELVQ